MRHIKLTTLLILLILVGLLTWRIHNVRKFHIVRTDPSTSQFSNAIPFFDVSFNKPLLHSGLKVTSSPNVVTNYHVDGKNIDMTLAPLSVNKDYKITISSVTATDNETIKSKTLDFVTKYINPSDLPKDQQAAILRNQDHFSSPVDDPIVKYLPHETLNYTLGVLLVSSPSGKPQLTLNAEITLTEADMSNEAAAVASYKQLIAAYIQSLGLNPANYQISYVISAP